MHACAHTRQRNKKQTPHTWHETLIFILRIVFPSWASSLVSCWKGISLSGGCFLLPLCWHSDCFTPGLVLILDRFYSRHFWLEDVRNWRVEAERKSWEWQEGFKKRKKTKKKGVICLKEGPCRKKSIQDQAACSAIALCSCRGCLCRIPREWPFGK